ncbi:MAG: energy transducer TonB [Vibrionaceae bacterium]|nr:energy transducer TonB [Vibrionaceae bacterium]
MSTKSSRFSQFILSSLLLHTLLVVWFYFQPDNDVVVAKADSVTISVGLQAAMAGANLVTPAQSATEKVEEVTEQITEVLEEPVETKSAPLPAEEQIIIPEKQIKPPKPAPNKPVTKQPVKDKVKPVKKVAHQQEKPPAPKKEKVKPKPELTVAKSTGDQGVDGATQVEVKEQETGTGQKSGGMANEEQFDFYVRQHLLSKKIVPKVLKARNKNGVVVVEFTVDRSGNLLDHKIAKTSRIRQFDRAAIKLVRKAEPFPKAPDFVTWKTRQYSIDISYSVK